MLLVVKLERKIIYIFINGSLLLAKRLQSAWHKWKIGADANTTILNVDFIGTTLYLVVQRSDGVYIETMDCAPAAVDTGATYLTYLDRKLDNTQIKEYL